MDCDKYKDRLTAYIDNALMPAEQAEFEQHLRACEKCRAGVEEIKKTISALKDLDEVEPPAWLTGRVMKKVRESTPKKGLLQRLFFPLHIKLPLEAFATLVVALAVIYVYRSIQPELQMAKAPTETIYKQEQQVGEKRSEPLKSPVLEQPFRRDDLRLKQEKQTEMLPEAGRPVAPAILPEEREPDEPRKLQPMLQKEAAAGKPAEAPRPPAPAASPAQEYMPSAGGVTRDMSRQEPVRSVPGLKTEDRERADTQSVLVLAVKDPEAAVKEAEKTIVEYGGSIEKKVMAENSAILFVRIPAVKSEAIIKKLSTLGTVRRQQTAPVRQGSPAVIKLVLEKQ